MHAAKERCRSGYGAPSNREGREGCTASCLGAEYDDAERAERQRESEQDIGIGISLGMAAVTFTFIPFFFCAADSATSCDEVPHNSLIKTYDRLSVIALSLSALRISNMNVTHRLKVCGIDRPQRFYSYRSAKCENQAASRVNEKIPVPPA